MDLDLFSGARGWEAAAADLDLDALGVELNATASATSRAAGFRTLEADVAALDPHDFAPVRGLIASPPCQTFSIAGKGSGRRDLDAVLAAVRAMASGEWPADFIASTGDVRTGLVLQPLRYALALRPEWLAWEQVPAVQPVWDAMADVLRAHGYSVATGVLNAEQYGVSQTRRRAVLVARLDGNVALPAPTHSRYYSHDPARLDPGVQPWVSMASVVGWGATARPSVTVTGGGTATGGAEPFGNAARRALATARDAGQWVARPDGTDSVRITVKEAARLQTFPAGHPFQGGKGARFLQVGNAIPPLLGRAILASVLGVA